MASQCRAIWDALSGTKFANCAHARGGARFPRKCLRAPDDFRQERTQTESYASGPPPPGPEGRSAAGNIGASLEVSLQRLPHSSIEGIRTIPAILIRYTRPAPKRCREHL